MQQVCGWWGRCEEEAASFSSSHALFFFFSELSLLTHCLCSKCVGRGKVEVVGSSLPPTHTHTHLSPLAMESSLTHTHTHTKIHREESSLLRIHKNVFKIQRQRIPYKNDFWAFKPQKSMSGHLHYDLGPFWTCFGAPGTLKMSVFWP